MITGTTSFGRDGVQSDKVLGHGENVHFSILRPFYLLQIEGELEVQRDI